MLTNSWPHSTSSAAKCMNKKLFTILATAVVILLIGLATRHYLFNPSDKQTASISTKSLFAATLPEADGSPHALKQWQGKIMVVNFWATWCAPCREEMPELSRLQDQYRDRGLIVLGIATDDLDKIRAFKKETPVSYPLLAGDIEAMSLGADLGNDKSVLPYTVILKADGTVAKTYFGRINQALLEETLIPLLQLQH